MAQILISPDDVVLGEPLEWNIFRADGTLAFHQGYVFNSKGMLARIVKNGLYRDNDEPVKGSSTQQENSEPSENSGTVTFTNQEGGEERRITTTLGDAADGSGHFTQTLASDGQGRGTERVVTSTLTPPPEDTEHSSQVITQNHSVGSDRVVSSTLTGNSEKSGPVVTSTQINRAGKIGGKRLDHNPATAKPKPKGSVEILRADILKSHAFSTVDSFSIAASGILQKILSGKVQARTQLLKLNMNLGNFAKSNQDMLIGAIHTYFPYPISSIQPVYSAFLCDLTAQFLGMDDERRASLRAAAITANVGMYHFQDQINDQVEPLKKGQVEDILLHPERSISLLEKVGVNDSSWLNAVAQHHEQPDGGGYPARLMAADIATEAKILNIADRYLAMISERAYNDTKHPKEVLKEIYQAAEGESKKILLAFIKTLGVYPPGTRVKLVNGEIAIVASRSGADSTKCVVASICDGGMGVYHEPIFRDTADKNFSISNFHIQAIPFRVPVEMIW